MRKIISIILSFGLLFQQSGLLYAAGEINLANYLSQAKSAIVQPDVFQPARLRYISYDAASNDFKMLLDKGDLLKGHQGFAKLPEEISPEKEELFNYFLIGLSLPNDTFWVNLRPDAPENIIDPLLEKTDIGKIFLEADLQLKKDTASLTSPQNPEGKAYWDKLYKKAGELFGTENITIPTITRPWIVPNEVIVRETEDSAYIYKATLKVMLEADYLQNQKTEKPKNPKTEEYGFSDPRLKELNEYSTQLIRETIIPKLTKEVNSSKRYAKLRQVYYSLVLARWFKQKYGSLGSARVSEPQSASASANSYISLIDSGNLSNLATQEPCDKQSYFHAYQKSFKDGEYNLKETVATPFGQSIRSYISGGLGMGFEYKAVNSPVVGLKVNSSPSPVTETLIGQPPATTASPLTIEQSKELFKEIVKIIREGEPADRYKKIPNMQDRKYDTFSSLKKLCEEFISYFEAESGLDSLKKGELWRLKKFSLSLNVSIIAEKFPEKFYQSIATKMALLNPTDKLTGIEYDPNGRPSHVRFRDAIKIDIKDGKGNVRPFYCDIKVFPDNKIENKYEVMLIQGSDRVSIIVSEHGIKPAPINTNLFYNFHSDEELIPVAQSIVSFFNYSRAAGSPLEGDNYKWLEVEDSIKGNIKNLGEPLDPLVDHRSPDEFRLIEAGKKLKGDNLPQKTNSPLTPDESMNYVDEALKKLTNFYQWDNKKSSDATLDDLIAAAEKAGESKLKPNAMEVSSEAEEWYAVADKLKEIKSVWSIYAGSPLTLEDVVRDIKRSREDLIGVYPDNETGLSAASIDELIGEARKAGESRQKINSIELSDEAEKWFQLAEDLNRIRAHIEENMSKYKEELVGFFSKLKEYTYIKLKEDDYAYYSGSYALEIKGTQDVNVIVKAAEHANWLRDSFLRGDSEIYNAYAENKEGAGLGFYVRIQSDPVSVSAAGSSLTEDFKNKVLELLGNSVKDSEGFFTSLNLPQGVKERVSFYPSFIEAIKEARHEFEKTKDKINTIQDMVYFIENSIFKRIAKIKPGTLKEGLFDVVEMPDGDKRDFAILFRDLNNSMTMNTANLVGSITNRLKAAAGSPLTEENKHNALLVLDTITKSTGGELYYILGEMKSPADNGILAGELQRMFDNAKKNTEKTKEEIKAIILDGLTNDARPANRALILKFVKDLQRCYDYIFGRYVLPMRFSPDRAKVLIACVHYLFQEMKNNKSGDMIFPRKSGHKEELVVG